MPDLWGASRRRAGFRRFLARRSRTCRHRCLQESRLRCLLPHRRIEEQMWPGPGSNRRPSAFQAEFWLTPMCFNWSERAITGHSDALEHPVHRFGPILAPRVRRQSRPSARRPGPSAGRCCPVDRRTRRPLSMPTVRTSLSSRTRPGRSGGGSLASTRDRMSGHPEGRGPRGVR